MQQMLLWKSNEYYTTCVCVFLRVFVCVCSLRYPECNAHAPYCPALQYFSTLSHKPHILEKTLLKMQCVFRVSLQLLSETFFVLRRNERNMIKKNLYWSSCKVPFILVPF